MTYMYLYYNNIMRKQKFLRFIKFHKRLVERLKIPRGQLHVGSTPTFGTKNYALHSFFYLKEK